MMTLASVQKNTLQFAEQTERPIAMNVWRIVLKSQSQAKENAQKEAATAGRRRGA